MDNKLEDKAGIRVGIIGLGTVGCGVIEVLRRNHLEIARRAGQPIFVNGVCARDKHKKRKTSIDSIPYYDSPEELIHSEEIDIVVELIGGCLDAKTYILSALACHKPVVTANKALLAEQGNTIFETARKQNGLIGFEAAVGGGIPIIKTLREGLGGNRIQAVVGIINGTCNYILSLMQERNCSFDKALEQAKIMGYVEADPSLDIKGKDAAHKLAILAANAFGIPLCYDRIFFEGIDHIELRDIQYAKELGFSLKHLGIAKETQKGIELHVHPTLIPKDHMLAHVEGVMNAILVQANALGPTLYYGAGAGSEATASAVVADLLDMARMIDSSEKQRVPYLAFHSLPNLSLCPIEEVKSAYYLRLEVEDKPGVLAQITRILADHEISIEIFIQKPLKASYVPLLIIIQPTKTRAFLEAKKQIEALDSINGSITAIRLDHLKFEECI
jgi:homoserine dehydrogenase